ncbi:uncharacterized protein LOC115882120 isoform X2 [Sitophilus oryzae]|uniref:Uncharacterized protein LOC115882120 isoform X2 n=1 Tax=Sitophilus oryzae TaxID=7048 RepID=A0A6J2XXM6_SITOR|nr:uncharacterized protein LOC115882120 isoform X2 [Sitophilus oryzae]
MDIDAATDEDTTFTDRDISAFSPEAFTDIAGPSSAPDNIGVQSPSSTVSVVSSISEPILLEIKDDIPKGLHPDSFSLKATVGLPYIPNPGMLSLSTATVKRLIDDTEEGRLIVASYKSGGVFLRQKLVSLIISNELSNNPRKRISSERFKTLAQEIYDLFPHEGPGVYYLPYVTENGDTRAASGK